MTQRSHPEVVVITGATAGVGRATAEAFARQGAHIGLLARGQERLESTRRRIEELGGKAIGISTDVADAEQVERAAARVEEEFGPIDVWVNNAMTSVFSPAIEIEPEEYKRVMEVNFLGFVHGTQSALERMLPRNRGSIVLVGSALAKRGIPLQAPYCASKHAIQGYFESLRTELLHDDSDIKLSIVHLPAINTPQFDWVKSRLDNRAQPVPPIYQPEVAADAIVYAAHNDRREVYVGAPTVKTIFGNRIAPWYADRYLAKNGYDGQQTDEPEDPNRPNNLWEPAPGDPGAHGRFDDRNPRARSPQLWATQHRTELGLAAIGIGLAIGLTAGLRS
ncbi:SDR family oxidoreductase [Persicimonas caeni]|uniref:SDR family oxidoreductase n=1 Tax=Persicimonas caeni TaxID=2292766 RepID=A0A4Y6Q2E5_PERCE|nr:SDR family oxidoreductase [Persicimonas caeni]QDG54736.1 SDR family oxidoreductase [Persicimonas caeni]QED35957.1 SDR family oxidoreductase [Persicimonas caeni]